MVQYQARVKRFLTQVSAMLFTSSYNRGHWLLWRIFIFIFAQ